MLADTYRIWQLIWMVKFRWSFSGSRSVLHAMACLQRKQIWWRIYAMYTIVRHRSSARCAVCCLHVRKRSPNTSKCILATICSVRIAGRSLSWKFPWKSTFGDMLDRVLFGALCAMFHTTIKNCWMWVYCYEYVLPPVRNVIVCEFHSQNHFRSHLDGKPHKCDHCEKRFSQSCDKIKHMRTYAIVAQIHNIHSISTNYSRSYLFSLRRHTGERPYECEICRQKFTQLTSLRKHRYLHSDERNYQCSVCGKGFRFSSNLVVHMRTQYVYITNDDVIPSIHLDMNFCLILQHRWASVCVWCVWESVQYVRSFGWPHKNPSGNSRAQMWCVPQRFHTCGQFGQTQTCSYRCKAVCCPTFHLIRPIWNIQCVDGNFSIIFRRYSCTYCLKNFSQVGHFKEHLRTQLVLLFIVTVGRWHTLIYVYRHSTVQTNGHTNVKNVTVNSDARMRWTPTCGRMSRKHAVGV